MEQANPLQTERNAKILKTIVYYIGFISLGLAAASLGPTLLDLAENTKTQVEEISILFTARSLGYLISSLLIGRVYDRRPGHPIMAGVLFTMATMLALAPVIPILWILTLAMFLLGLGEGCLDVGTNALFFWVHRENVGPYMNGLHFFFGLGAFLSPVIIAQVVYNTGDITWAYWLLALCMLPAAIGLIFLPSPARPVISASKEERAKDYRLVFTACAFLFLYVGAEISYGGWVSSYTRALDLADQATAAYLTAAFWGALTLGRLLAVPISTRVSSTAILVTSLLGCIASVMVILFGQGSMTAIWIGTLGLGLSMAAIFPTTLTFVEQHIQITGQITSFFFVGSSLGGMTLPWLIGQLFGAKGPQWTIYIILIDLVIAMGVFFLMNSYQPRSRLPVESKI